MEHVFHPESFCRWKTPTLATLNIAVLYLLNFIFLLFFSGDIIMTGEGHKDWLSDGDFHPGYAMKFS